MRLRVYDVWVNTTTATVNLRLIYMAIYITHDDEPEDRIAWSSASAKDQRQAANAFHAEHGGAVPPWAYARKRRVDPLAAFFRQDSQ